MDAPELRRQVAVVEHRPGREVVHVAFIRVHVPPTRVADVHRDSGSGVASSTRHDVKYPIVAAKPWGKHERAPAPDC